MENINIRKSTHWDRPYYVVRATTKRFGYQEVMCESFKLQDCIDYIKRCGFEPPKVERMQYRGYNITRRIDGTYLVKYKDSLGGVYQFDCKDFAEAGANAYEIADNNDIGSAVCIRMSERFRGNFVDGDHLH